MPGPISDGTYVDRRGIISNVIRKKSSVANPTQRNTVPVNILFDTNILSFSKKSVNKLI